MNKKTIKKALLLTVCAILLVVASVMGTLAYLTSQDQVTNTFTVGKVNIELSDIPDLHLIPGSTYDVDAAVTVKAGSEACWVFIDVINPLSAIEVAVDTSNDVGTIADQIEARGWAKLTGATGATGVVYAMKIDAVNVDNEIGIFEQFKLNDLWPGAAAMDGIEITAYAIQRENIGDSAAEAWAALQAQLATP